MEEAGKELCKAVEFAKIRGELVPGSWAGEPKTEVWSYWQTVRDEIYLLGIEVGSDLAWAEFDGLLTAAHQEGVPTLRDWIKLGLLKNMASEFEKRFLERMDIAREKWCKQHGKNPETWKPNILDNNTDNLKGIFKIPA